VFLVRYELNLYIIFRRNSVFIKVGTLISKLIQIIRSKNPVQHLSSVYNDVHFLTLYLLHFLMLYPPSKVHSPERRMSTAWEP
jgi:hypothetical protein